MTDTISPIEAAQDAFRRFDDPNLVGVGVLGEGRARLRQGQVADGMALLAGRGDAGGAVR